MDPRLIAVIETFVREGVSNAREMKRLLDLHVKTVICSASELPKKFSRRFYPKKSSIRSKMMRAIRKNRCSNIDQDCLKAKIAEWKLEDSSRNIFFREKMDLSNVHTEESNLER